MSKQNPVLTFYSSPISLLHPSLVVLLLFWNYFFGINYFCNSVYFHLRKKKKRKKIIKKKKKKAMVKVVVVVVALVRCMLNLWKNR